MICGDPLCPLVPTYNLPKRLDCGIAMLHIEVAALYHGVRGC
ncbi:hypothetical protein [Neomoorella mulderi]|nr:hypothetical protein [Moorella mulderi]